MTLSGNRKLVPTPGYTRVPSDAQQSGIELVDGQLLPISTADEARLRYNAVTGNLEVSLNSGPYVEVLVAGATGLVTDTDPGAVNPYPAAVDGEVFCSDGATNGGVWRNDLNVQAGAISAPTNPTVNLGAAQTTVGSLLDLGRLLRGAAPCTVGEESLTDGDRITAANGVAGQSQAVISSSGTTVLVGGAPGVGTTAPVTVAVTASTIELTGNTETDALRLTGPVVTDSKEITSAMSPYTVLITDPEVLSVNLTGGPVRIILPVVATSDGRSIDILDWLGLATAVNSLTVECQGADTIDGGASVVITNAYGSLGVYCGSTEWRSVSSNILQRIGTMLSPANAGDGFSLGTGRLLHGASPATVGEVALSDTDRVTCRTGAVDQAVISSSGTTVTVGGVPGVGTTRPVTCTINPNTAFAVAIGVTDRLNLSSTALALTVPSLTINAALGTPSIKQSDLNTAGASGQTFTQQAQSVTAADALVAGGLQLRGGLSSGVAGTGGFVSVEAGTGAAANGYIKLGWVGATYPTAGEIRVPDTTRVTCRTGAVDQGVISSNGTTVTVGGAPGVGTTRPTTALVDAATTSALQVAGTSIVSCTSSAVAIGAADVTFGATLLDPEILQADDATASVTCDNTIYGAQRATNAAGGASAARSGQACLVAPTAGGHADNYDGNIALITAPAANLSTLGAEKCCFIGKAVAAPTLAPTNGFILYVDPATGNMLVLGEDNTLTTLALK